MTTKEKIITKEFLKFAWLPKKVEGKWIWLKSYWSLYSISRHGSGPNWADPGRSYYYVALEVGRRRV